MNRLYLNRQIKDIPVKSKIIREKFIIHDTNKVLFFKKCNRDNVFFIPRMFNSESEILWEDFIKRFSGAYEENSFFESISYELRFEANNYSLKKIYHEYIRQYYSCYVEFDEKLTREISDFAFQTNLEPYLFTFREVKKMSKNKGIIFDESLPYAVNVLEQKIKKYVRY